MQTERLKKMHIHPEDINQAIEVAKQNIYMLSIIAPGLAAFHQVTGNCCIKAGHARYLCMAAYREITKGE